MVQDGWTGPVGPRVGTLGDGVVIWGRVLENGREETPSRGSPPESEGLGRGTTTKSVVV